VHRVCLVLLAVVAAVLAGNLDAVYAVPDEAGVPYSEDVVRQPNPAPCEDGGFIVGTIDTVGGTTYDYGCNGSLNRMIVNSPGHGLHVLWMYSQSTSGTSFSDRNMRYNYYDYTAGAWSWVDPDYMNSGVNVFTERAGYGNIQADSTGAAIVSGHIGSSGLSSIFALDLEAGAGFFDYSTLSNYLWPAIAIGQNGYLNASLLDDPGRATLFAIQSQTWNDWGTAQNLVSISSPQQVIEASKVSDKVCITWVPGDYSTPTGGCYRISTDAGTTWEPVQNLPAPPAFTGDTTASFWVSGFSPFYDKFDRLHIVASVTAFSGGSGLVTPAAIWHWSPDNSPAWTEVQYAALVDPLGHPGLNSVSVCRPVMSEDESGGLYVTWEQFDASNAEPGPPERLRADIYYAQDNGDHGQTWQAPVKITDTDETSKRFPSATARLLGDTLVVSYFQDLKSGSFVQSENVATNNPMIVHRVPVTIGVKEGKPAPVIETISVQPNPFTGRAKLSYTLPRASDVELNVFDLAGREVAGLCDRHQAAGQYSAVWDATGLTPGVYIARLKAGEKMLTQKLVLQ